MLKVQEYLRSHSDANKALEMLTEEYGIKVVRINNLVCLNYDICSPVADIPNECRGLILEIPNFNVISFSFKRFFNYGQGHAPEINWSTAHAFDKIDGTLIVFYHYNGHWRVQTRGVPDASGEVPAQTGEHFRYYVERLVYDKGINLDDLCKGLPENYCIVCEYVGPYNRIVTEYNTEDLYLLAMTDRNTCTDVVVPKDWKWLFSKPKKHLIDSIDNVIMMTKTLEALDEGFVVVDDFGNRIKVKAESYRVIARLINAGKDRTEKHYARIVLSGRMQEIIEYFPEMTDKLNLYSGVLVSVCSQADELWSQYGRIEDRKEFAIAVKHAKLSAWLFVMYSKKTDQCCKDWVIENVRPEKLVQWSFER